MIYRYLVVIDNENELTREYLNYVIGVKVKMKQNGHVTFYVKRESAIPQVDQIKGEIGNKLNINVKNIKISVEWGSAFYSDNETYTFDDLKQLCESKYKNKVVKYFGTVRLS